MRGRTKGKGGYMEELTLLQRACMGVEGRMRSNENERDKAL